jgi:hypothetical protein
MDDLGSGVNGIACLYESEYRKLLTNAIYGLLLLQRR